MKLKNKRPTDECPEDQKLPLSEIEDLGSFDDDTLVSPSFTGVTVGVTELELWVDDGVDFALDSTILVVYDPSSGFMTGDGFVTGGGWIDSPAGAYAAQPSLTGTANFGFVSKYKKGASIPTGQTEFVFKAGDLNFHSSSYDWLVVAGTKAKFKGDGTINGAGSYGFMLTARDGVPDTFRIKIWDKDNADAVVYDNQFGDEDDAELTTTIGGGNIIVHKGK